MSGQVTAQAENSLCNISSAGLLTQRAATESLPPSELARGRAFRSRCQPHRKRESERDVSDCRMLRSRLRY
jgi:hypothetical protein